MFFRGLNSFRAIQSPRVIARTVSGKESPTEMDEVFVEPFDGSLPEREPNDPFPEREGKFLEAETMIALNDLCGRVWDKWLGFGAFQAMEPGVERLGYQINIYQLSKRQTHESNAKGISEGGFSAVLQTNPERRFSIEIFRFIEGGMHYLKTYFEVDAGGKVLHLCRRKARDNKFLPKPLVGEQPGTLHFGDLFRKKIYDESGITPFLVPMPIDADARAKEQMDILTSILSGSVVRLSPTDPYNTCGQGRDRHRDVGYGVMRD